MSKGWWSLVGFLLFIIGFSSLCLLLVGVKYSWLAWIDAPGPLIGFVIRLLFIISGIVVLYLSRADFAGEDPVR